MRSLMSIFFALGDNTEHISNKNLQHWIFLHKYKTTTTENTNTNYPNAFIKYRLFLTE